MPGALAGIRVVDFTEYIAGPYCTMMLADMGADVVKVERPQGDAWRHTATVAPYESRGFLGVNRGKRSIALDMDREEGRAIVQRLIARADVVTMNSGPGVAGRLGIDYAAVSASNPGLVYCENSAFGNSGPYSGRAGYDILSQAATGMVLYENKIDRGTPSYISSVAIADLSTGMFMAFAIASALYTRAATGRGQRIETNLFASGLAAQYRPLLSIEAQDRPIREAFLRDLSEARKQDLRFEEAQSIRGAHIAARGHNNYYRIYETKDGLIAVACLNNRQRRRLRDALGIEDETVDGISYDWFSEKVRETHRRTVQVFDETFRSTSTSAWLERLEAANVPCNQVSFPEEVYDDPHVRANSLMLSIEHPVLGELRMPACPIDMSDTPAGTLTPPPPLGAHGPEVLRELGYDDETIERLLNDGVLYTRERLIERDSEG
jgi:crotonobetainyl-CoA:carnitine CoA-transferase CaiB-like acyl-CoA transferase